MLKIIICLTMVLLAVVPLIYLLNKNPMQHEIESQIEDWHNFRKALEKGEKK